MIRWQWPQTSSPREWRAAFFSGPKGEPLFSQRPQSCSLESRAGSAKTQSLRVPFSGEREQISCPNDSSEEAPPQATNEFQHPAVSVSPLGRPWGSQVG